MGCRQELAGEKKKIKKNQQVKSRRYQKGTGQDLGGMGSWGWEYGKRERLEPSETTKRSAEECHREEEVRTKQTRAGFLEKELKPFSEIRNSGDSITVLRLSGSHYA